MEKTVIDRTKQMLETPIREWPQVAFAILMLLGVAIFLAINASLYHFQVWAVGCDQMPDCTWNRAYADSQETDQDDAKIEKAVWKTE